MAIRAALVRVCPHSGNPDVGGDGSDEQDRTAGRYQVAFEQRLGSSIGESTLIDWTSCKCASVIIRTGHRRKYRRYAPVHGFRCRQPLPPQRASATRRSAWTARVRQLRDRLQGCQASIQAGLVTSGNDQLGAHPRAALRDGQAQAGAGAGDQDAPARQAEGIEGSLVVHLADSAFKALRIRSGRGTSPPISTRQVPRTGRYRSRRATRDCGRPRVPG